MEIVFTEWVAVSDTSSVGEVRRMATDFARRLDFDETQTGQLALLATEVSRNVLVHGGGGQVILTGLNDGKRSVVQLLAIDRGPGIPDVGRALGDGFSTGGTMGGGLGAMKRIASTFEIFTGSGGTVVLLEVGQTAPATELQISGFAVPYPGERICGDNWTFHSEPGRSVALLADGLGHGIGAADAANEAVAAFQKHVDRAPGEILSYIHDALRKTRGAVAGVAEIRPREGSLVFAGVGNISAVLVENNGARHFVSHSGTLGHSAPRIQEFRMNWEPRALPVLVLHSDGVQTRWDLADYMGLVARHPAVIGGTLLRDFRRQRDDASIVVVKAA